MAAQSAQVPDNVVNTQAPQVKVPSNVTTTDPVRVKQLESQLATQRLESERLEAQLQAQRSEIQRLEERKLVVKDSSGPRIGERVPGGETFAEQRRKAQEQLTKIEVQKQREAQQQLEIQRMEEYVRQLEFKRLEAQRLEGRSGNTQTPSYIYSDELISGIVDWAVKLHQLGGMTRLESESQTCYSHSGNRYRCVYFDLAARKIDTIGTGSFSSGSSAYFSDANFAGRLTPLFRMGGYDDAAVNSFLRSEAARVNVYVVQKVKLDSFVK